MYEISNYVAGLGFYECIGVTGFICYVTAFGSVQLGLMDGNSAPYSLLNILAACLVGISLFADFNLASALIQGSWIIIGLIGLALRGWRPIAARPASTSFSSASRRPQIPTLKTGAL